MNDSKRTDRSDAIALVFIMIAALLTVGYGVSLLMQG